MNRKLPYLQIARAIAALIVVLHHITGMAVFYFNFNPLGGIFSAGWNGVDFFFVLSGFIIYYIHSKDLGKPAEWRHYFAKRIIRIYPIYWIIAAVAFLFLLIGNSSISDSALSGNLLKSSYLIKSLLLIPQNVDPFLRVAWSLCYEMFFYIMFGFCILFGRKTGILFILFYLILLSAQLLHWFPISENSIFSFPSSNYNLEFLIGILVAWCFRSVESSPGSPFVEKWVIRLFLAAGILIFAGAWSSSLYFQYNFGKFSIYTRLFYGMASGLILFGIANLRLRKLNVLTGFFLLLGDASYVLYLIHPLALAILFKLIMKAGFHKAGLFVDYSLCLLALLICVSAGILLHTKLEKPMLLAFNRSIQKRKPAVISPKKKFHESIDPS